MNGYNYYRIKTAWTGEGDDGGMTKLKAEELAYVTSYTEAERIAHTLIAAYGRNRHSEPTFEIIKTKMEEVLHNNNLQTAELLVENLVECFFEEADDTGVGLYGVKVMFIQVDEKTAKEKRSHSTIYVPARSNADASALVSAYLKASPERGDFVIRNATFDAASAIFWPQDFYKQLTTA